VWRKAKNNKQHDEQFISSGLWSISRHPKYVKDSVISNLSRLPAEFAFRLDNVALKVDLSICINLGADSFVGGWGMACDAQDPFLYLTCGHPHLAQ
jgi:hypothetical protein